MEVKNIDGTPTTIENPQPYNSQREASALPSVPPLLEEPVKVSVNSQALENNGPRTRINQLINVINLVSDTERSVTQMLNSITGIIEQVEAKPLSPLRQQALEVEANSLAAGISEAVRALHASLTTSTAAIPNGDIGKRVEETLRQALEVIFPPEKEALSPAKLSFSRKEAIIETRVSVERVRQRLDDLSQAIAESTKELKEAIAATEAVVSADSSASLASLRDVKQAAELSRETSKEIERRPDQALQSTGDFTKVNVQLLE